MKSTHSLIGIHINKAKSVKTIHRDKTFREDFSTTRLKALLDAPIIVTEADVEQYRNEVYQVFTESSIRDLVESCRKEAISNIIGPLGLGSFMSLYDKLGGNVDTIFNVRRGIYATDKERQRYKNRDKYDKNKYHSSDSYRNHNAQMKEKRKKGELIDPYTGKPLSSEHDLDHTIPAKEIHDDPGRTLAEQDGVELANADSNLTATDPSINRSKGQLSMSEFIQAIENKKREISNQIENLKKKEKENGNLTDTQKKSLQELEDKLEKLDGLDYEKMLAADEKARKEYDHSLNVAYYTSGKFIKKLASTSLKEAGKMGIRQALGLLLCDLTNALFDELTDCWKNGIAVQSNEKPLSAMRRRLKRVGEKVIRNWKNLIWAFRDGAISGFLSNLLTVFLNTFMTTAKNIIRIIRDGMSVLYGAAKAWLFPNQGLSKEEARDAALKLLVAGALSVGGIALEELVAKTFAAVPIPGKELLISIGVGVLTGVATAVVMYALDKWDPFGAKDAQKREAVAKRISDDWERLKIENEQSLGRIENLLAEAGWV